MHVVDIALFDKQTANHQRTQLTAGSNYNSYYGGYYINPTITRATQPGELQFVSISVVCQLRKLCAGFLKAVQRIA